MKNQHVRLWMLLLLPLLVCFESSAYAQDPPKVHPSETPTCTINIIVKSNRREYNTRPTLYRDNGTATLNVPRVYVDDAEHFQFSFVNVGTYFVKVQGNRSVTPEKRAVYCRAGQTYRLPFKITGT